MQERTLGPFRVSTIGYGCMSLSHGYGSPVDKSTAKKLLNKALDLGYSLLDTAALYGYGANEELVGEILRGRRGEFTLASKCGLFRNEQGAREVNGRPEMLKKTCDDSLRRLRTDVIDLYYLHRLDPQVPIEDSIGALSELVDAGKIRTIGLSEVSAQTLRKAHAVHPITALQNEYSLMSRNPEIASLSLCRDLGVAYVAFSPIARGFLSEDSVNPEQLEESDIRRFMPRFQGDALQENRQLLARFQDLARRAGCSSAQLALNWLLSRGEHVVPIPGTTSLAHLEENAAAGDLKPDPEILEAAGRLIHQGSVRGERYPPAAMAEIDTENF